MKSYITEGEGASQNLYPIQNEKIPIYDTEQDAESDLANLAEGQIVGTKENKFNIDDFLSKQAIQQQVILYSTTAVETQIDFKTRLATLGYNIDDFDEVVFSTGSNQYPNENAFTYTLYRVDGFTHLHIYGNGNDCTFDWSTGILSIGSHFRVATFRKYGSGTNVYTLS